jgi:membrane protease YdiL (CAAX protease family)
MKTPIKLVVIYLLIQLVVGVLVSIISLIVGLQDPNLAKQVGITLLAPSLLVSIAIMLYYLYKKHYIPTAKETWSFVSPVYILLTIILAFSCILIVDCLTNYLQWMPDLMKSTFDSMSTGVIGIITIAIIGPFLEELLFRGAVTRLLLERYKPQKAILISALIFGIFHINPAQIIPAFLIGLILATIYYRTHSLIPGLIIHIINNSASTIMGIYYPSAKTLHDIVSGNIYWILIINAVFFFLFAVYFMQRSHKKQEQQIVE